MAKIILGITGEMASGKGTVAKYAIEKYGAGSHRFSTMLRDVTKRMHQEESRDNLQNISTCLRQCFGEDILAKVMAEDVKKDSSEIIVIDGVRRLPDIKYLKEIPGFKLIYIETDLEKRYERIVKRGENSDDLNKTFEEFQKDQEKEAEQQIRGLKFEADFTVDNNGSLEDLYKQLDEILNKK